MQQQADVRANRIYIINAVALDADKPDENAFLSRQAFNAIE